jgi:hypothetical protein
MTWNLDIDWAKLERGVTEGGIEGVDEALEHIRGVAVGRTPVETGHLAGSEAPTDASDQGAEIVGSIEVPGPYARYQELREDLHHETGQAHYLGSSFTSEQHTAEQIIANRIQGRI